MMLFSNDGNLRMGEGKARASQSHSGSDLSTRFQSSSAQGLRRNLQGQDSANLPAQKIRKW